MFNLPRFARISAQKAEVCCCYSTSTKEIKPVSKMPTELTKRTDVASKVEFAKTVTNADLKWRTAWHQQEGQYYSTLRTFYSEHNNTQVLKFLQSPIKLSPSDILAWWARKKEEKAAILQHYIPQRNQMLGNELAAAHFIVHRGGAVKFFGENNWIKADYFNEYSLPDRFKPDMYLQAIDCSNMPIIYEGLANLRDLQQVEWFSINACEKIDDWCMDRISCVFCHSLLYLDIRECPLITHRGLGALAKMKKLKILYVDDILQSDEYEMTCLMLQENNPDLDIRTE